VAPVVERLPLAVPSSRAAGGRESRVGVVGGSMMARYYTGCSVGGEKSSVVDFEAAFIVERRRLQLANGRY